MTRRLTDREIRERKERHRMELIAKKCSYYRQNPHRFATEFLRIELKLFQKILIYAMEHYDYFYYVASRGQGKTFLVALYAVIRCILYPGTKCVVCSYTYKQGLEIVNKITNDFMLRSPPLRYEIESVSNNTTKAIINFKNRSYIEVRTSGESARGGRSNLLIIDEARQVDKRTMDEILRPFNADSRHPGYLDNPKYYHLQEKNKEIYMSSAWYKQSEMYDQVKSYFANFLDPSRKYFVCALPYQLSIKEGLLMREQIEDIMSEATFSEVSFMMEREAKFYGATEDALFSFDVLNARRNLQNALRDLEYYEYTDTPIPRKVRSETRILSLDVALLASRKHDNDASCFILNQCIGANTNMPVSNISYIDTKEGILTEELGLLTMRYFYHYDCDYLGLDCSGRLCRSRR